MGDRYNLGGKGDEIHSKILCESPLSFAFLGDGVWSLLVRDFFCTKTNFKNTTLHLLTTKFVKASYQAVALDKLKDILSDEEKDIARRARNSKLMTTPKNTSIYEYKKATSFEAILGYHYLLKNYSRIEEIFNFLKSDLEKVLKSYDNKR